MPVTQTSAGHGRTGTGQGRGTNGGRAWLTCSTNGVPAGERHVRVAGGRDYGDVTPIKGVHSGGGSQSLRVVVEVTRLQ